MTPDDRLTMRAQCLERVRFASDLRRELEGVQRTAMRGARTLGASWVEIAKASDLPVSTARRMAQR